MINDKKLDRMYDELSLGLDPGKIRQINRSRDDEKRILQTQQAELAEQRKLLESETKQKEEGFLNFLSNLVAEFEQRKQAEDSERTRIAKDTEKQRQADVETQKQRDLDYLESIKTLEALSKAVEQKIKSLEGEVQALALKEPEKPEKVDLSPLTKQLNTLKKEITALKNKKIKVPSLDLGPVIEAITQPREVEFSIEYDQWDYPIKITASEKNG